MIEEIKRLSSKDEIEIFNDFIADAITILKNERNSFGFKQYSDGILGLIACSGASESSIVEFNAVVTEFFNEAMSEIGSEPEKAYQQKKNELDKEERLHLRMQMEREPIEKIKAQEEKINRMQEEVYELFKKRKLNKLYFGNIKTKDTLYAQNTLKFGIGSLLNNKITINILKRFACIVLAFSYNIIDHDIIKEISVIIDRSIQEKLRNVKNDIKFLEKLDRISNITIPKSKSNLMLQIERSKQVREKLAKSNAEILNRLKLRNMEV